MIPPKFRKIINRCSRQRLAGAQMTGGDAGQSEMRSMSTAVQAQNVTISLGGAPVVADVSFTVESGAVAAIIGPNGSGKTTLLRALAGFIQYQGEIKLFGRPPADSRGQIGYVPQRLEIDRTLPITVREFLQLSSPECFLPHCQHTDLYQRLGIPALGPKILGELSGGQFQRVLVARALLDQPKILFLDEPASGIDASGQETLYQVIRHVSREHHTTVIMVSHEFEVVYQYASQVLCLNRKLLCNGRPGQVMNEANLRALYGQNAVAYSHHHDVA